MWIKQGSDDDVYEYVKKHPHSAKMRKFKEKLINIDYSLHDVFKYRFELNMSFRAIENLMDLSVPRIKEIEKTLVTTLRIEFDI